MVSPQQVEPVQHRRHRQNGHRRSKRDVSVNSRYTRHSESCGSTDFKTRFEETKTVLKICPARTDTRANGQASCCVQDLLNMINGDKNFLDKVITGDESWFFRV